MACNTDLHVALVLESTCAAKLCWNQKLSQIINHDMQRASLWQQDSRNAGAKHHPHILDMLESPAWRRSCSFHCRPYFYPKPWTRWKPVNQVKCVCAHHPDRCSADEIERAAEQLAAASQRKLGQAEINIVR